MARKISSDEKLVTAWFGRLNPNTVRSYQLDIQNFRKSIKSKLFKQVTTADIKRFVVINRKASTAVQNRRLSTVRSLFRFAVEQKYLKINPAASVRDWAKEVSPRRNDILTETEIQELLASAPDDRFHIMFSIMYYLAVTATELASIKWGDFRVKNGRHFLIVTSARSRQIEIPDHLCDALRRFHPDNATNDDPLLLSRNGGNLHSHTIQATIKKFTKDAGFPQITPMWLRTAHARHAFLRGAKIEDLQETLGLRSVKAIMRHISVPEVTEATAELLPLPKIRQMKR